MQIVNIFLMTPIRDRGACIKIKSPNDERLHFALTLWVYKQKAERVKTLSAFVNFIKSLTK